MPKSKTWFLGGRMAKAKAKGSKSRRRSTLALEAAAALEVADDEPAVKREPRPADPLVFLGSEDIVLDDKFELKRPAAAIEHLKSRVSSGLGAVSGIMAKLSGLAEQPEKESTSNVAAEEEKKEKKPEVEADEAKIFPDLGPVIATEEVENYSDKVSQGPQILA